MTYWRTHFNCEVSVCNVVHTFFPIFYSAVLYFEGSHGIANVAMVLYQHVRNVWNFKNLKCCCLFQHIEKQAGAVES